MLKHIADSARIIKSPCEHNVGEIMEPFRWENSLSLFRGMQSTPGILSVRNREVQRPEPTIAEDTKYDCNTEEDLELFESIPAEKKRRALIPISVISQAEWSEREHLDQFGIDFHYDSFFTENGTSTQFHLKELRTLHQKVTRLLAGKAVEELNLKTCSFTENT